MHSDAQILAELQSMLTQSISHTSGPTRTRIQQRLQQGWRPTLLFQVVGGVASMELRLQDAGGLHYLCLRSVRPGKGELKL
jgi:hypothetical protein